MKVKRVFLKAVAVCTAILLVIIFSMETRAANVGNKYNMSYIYFGNAATYTGYVDRTQDSLNEISPNYFVLNADGSLKLTTAVSASFVNEMHEKGIRVVPYLSNNWDRPLGIAALGNRSALAVSLADAVRAYDLDGIGIDLENLTPDERTAQTDFVRQLRELLPDKILTVAVAANPWGTDLGWQGSYDYAGLAQYCDYLMIMAYDEHSQSGHAGSVAGLPFVEKSLQYALKRVPKEKIVLGLPFYGRIWKNGGGYPQGYGISNIKVEELLPLYRGKVAFDLSSQTPYATITIKDSDKKPVIGGVSLQAGTYTIWYENEASLKLKLRLVKKYDIMGTGSWSLGQETASTWNYYKLWLNGCYFADIQNHWARDNIFLAFEKGWIKGESETYFSPDAPLTRAQAAAILVRALGLPTVSQGTSFDDTKGHWAQAEIETARQYGLINGVGNNLFAPDKSITREEMAVLMNNMDFLKASVPGDAAAPVFTDVSLEQSPWSYEAISAMSRLSILKGFTDGSFRPSEPLLRAEMAVLIERIIGFLPEK